MCHITNKTLGEVEALGNLYGISFALNRLLQCGFNATMNTTMIPDTYLLPPPQPTIGARFLGHKFGGLVALPTALEVAECLFAAVDDMHEVPAGAGAILAQLQTLRPAFPVLCGMRSVLENDGCTYSKLPCNLVRNRDAQRFVVFVVDAVLEAGNRINLPCDRACVDVAGVGPA
jgi:hypothetical protein